VINQSYSDFEIVVIDDGSTDDTKEVVLSIQDNRVKYFYQENSGCAAARNTGIINSSGKYIAFLDSDDVWLDDKLTSQVDFLKSQSEFFPGCVTGYFIQDESGKVIRIIQDDISLSMRQILWKNTLHMGTTWMSLRKTFDIIGLHDPKLVRGQDSDWMIRYLRHFPIGNLKSPLAIFNRHGGVEAEKIEKTRIIILERYDDLFRNQGEIFYKSKRAEMYKDLASRFLFESNYNKAKKYIHLAMSSSMSILDLQGLIILFDCTFKTNLKNSLSKIIRNY
jgi:glycosyltransferase involved in cell wall biosynthesis